ncbi:MAG: nucleotidyltransferase domain-containing protein [Deltaproteobacteria bacterium]|nr:nucleotidyltransferase domain-containing protein [Deltaproteobacteria bacterium]
MAAKEKKVEQALRSLVGNLKAGLGRNLIAVVLFGSRARGEEQRESDWDIFILARSLPTSPMKRYACVRGMSKAPLEGGVSYLAKTQREFEEGFPSFYLDLALDGIILYDTKGYMQAKLKRIQEIIEEAGLKRERIPGGFFWDWKEYPGGREWEISWKGFEAG